MLIGYKLEIGMMKNSPVDAGEDSEPSPATLRSCLTIPGKENIAWAGNLDTLLAFQIEEGGIIMQRCSGTMKR